MSEGTKQPGSAPATPADNSRIREFLSNRDNIGRLMHESWMKTKRAQGFHGMREACPNQPQPSGYYGRDCCHKCHADLIPWEELPEIQKDINRHAFDAVLEALPVAAEASEKPAEPPSDDLEREWMAQDKYLSYENWLQAEVKRLRESEKLLTLAESAMGGNPAIYLHDRIYQLKAELERLRAPEKPQGEK